MSKALFFLLPWGNMLKSEHILNVKVRRAVGLIKVWIGAAAHEVEGDGAGLSWLPHRDLNPD